jgi:uncharacterized RDD family membrane protein YckC
LTEPTGDAAAPLEASQPIVHWEAPEPQVGPAPGYEFARHGGRLVAYILDCILIYILLVGPLLVLYAIGGAIGSDISRPRDVSAGRAANPDAFSIFALVVVLILGIVLVFGYFPFFWARSGQTPGMKPFGLVVVRDADGGPLRTRTAILRLIGLYIASSVFYLGFIWIFIDKRRRGWHDLIAGTVVVHRPKGRSST